MKAVSLRSWGTCRQLWLWLGPERAVGQDRAQECAQPAHGHGVLRCWVTARSVDVLAWNRSWSVQPSFSQDTADGSAEGAEPSLPCRIPSLLNTHHPALKRARNTFCSSRRLALERCWVATRALHSSHQRVMPTRWHYALALVDVHVVCCKDGIAASPSASECFDGVSAFKCCHRLMVRSRVGLTVA